ncbi:uncharacterized protein SAPINGB_P005303 [Magnusiomyces paraingens]|uniref:Uncharacterized protein n=1 Tax=Magnusiomyces paraingens TaxID=2606893 RepID=A0A5E8C6F7_9ASCO|nr:uncharacterized protein SAPINGB_P005303 [Saprochaete ingens]VVT56816.1 unnamed protein product [Saprochaete ingens]
MYILRIRTNQTKCLISQVNHNGALSRRFFSRSVCCCKPIVQIKDVQQLPHKISPTYTKDPSTAPKNTLYHLSWPKDQHPRNVFLVKKPWQPHVRQAMVDFILFLAQKYPKVNVIVEPDVAEEIEPDFAFVKQPNLPSSISLYTTTADLNLQRIYHKSDLLVTFGGDGTILKAVSMFSSVQAAKSTSSTTNTNLVAVPPPVLSFSLGTLGFLMPFHITDAHSVFAKVHDGTAPVMHRRRLKCSVYKDARTHKVWPTGVPPPVFANPSSDPTASLEQQQHTASVPESVTFAMNDINIHRGPDPHLTYLDITVNAHYLTTAIADGVIIATPTGSTAYSLSSGGSIIHPAVPCTLITPICPRSLSFRPLVFPGDSTIEIAVSPLTRGQSTEISIDGANKGVLSPGDKIVIEPEDDGPVPGAHSGIWCVAKSAGDWIGHLNGLLGFNSKFGAKP